MSWTALSHVKLRKIFTRLTSNSTKELWKIQRVKWNWKEVWKSWDTVPWNHCVWEWLNQTVVSYLTKSNPKENRAKRHETRDVSYQHNHETIQYSSYSRAPLISLTPLYIPPFLLTPPPPFSSPSQIHGV